MDIQMKLDEWLENNPEFQKYVSKIWYIREGDEAPAGVTHRTRLSSQAAHERALNLGLVVVPPYAMMLDALLALVATSGQIPDGFPIP